MMNSCWSLSAATAPSMISMRWCVGCRHEAECAIWLSHLTLTHLYVCRQYSLATVWARPGRLSAPSGFLCESVLYGAFVWAHWALNSPKRWFPVRAVAIFAPAYPLAPLLALFRNLYEVRADASHFCTMMQRPHFQICEDIGTWCVELGGAESCNLIV